MLIQKVASSLSVEFCDMCRKCYGQEIINSLENSRCDLNKGSPHGIAYSQTVKSVHLCTRNVKYENGLSWSNSNTRLIDSAKADRLKGN